MTKDTIQTDHQPRNAYEERQERRRERLETAADRQRQEADRRFEKSGEGLPPMGQPILIGHHSEKRHRRALERSHDNMRKGVEASERAAELAGRAAAVGRGGISADDPDAISKLKEKLTTRQAAQERNRTLNKVWRQYSKKPDAPATVRALDALSAQDRAVVTTYKPQYSWERGPAQDYEMSNNSAQIRRLKTRIKQLEVQAEAETVEAQHDGYKIVENAEENRLQIFFDDIPSAEIRQELKSHGFKWARSVGAWQRQLNNSARYSATYALRSLNRSEG